ncbi:Trp biosynthesis-associated membrane protein [Arthrobacter sp. StoSoilB5]|jgi:uncharacterized membrane protein (TIGR02234 family)|uniref:Trp biosynthesis-associated membrane protein n=1 Tax=Arthrobacter sp. StoSoilB5 TaxID=2830992 RepID=UPI001CC5A9DC|nr:Trp biosynthesis-associated membrane protein [Arthrobacter sp. StoSoilB5]BCW44646.1 hypothetical protein StoSoilB5_18300 [Arthrobacter sp. StoSoilB5]
MTAEAPRPTAATSPRWARKSTLVLATALLALAVFGTTTQTWIEVRLDPTAASISDLHVQGSKAATAVTALALVALAGGLAASIAGRIARWIIAAILVLSAAGIILAAATVLVDPLGAAQGSIAAATGISGGQANVATTVFPVLAVVAGALLAVCAVVLPLAGRHWKTRTKYDAAAVRERRSGPVDEIDSWDSLSRGEDPT